MNIMYNKPIVENNLIDPSWSSAPSPIKPNPFGPIITPEMISPIILGIRIFLNKIGDKSIIKRSNENTRIGFLIGS
jgi:hypothetical protein